MKKIALLFAAVVCAATVSCSDDDAAEVAPGSNMDLLVGKWSIESIAIDNNTQGEPLSDCSTGTYKEFNADGKFYEYFDCGGAEPEEDVWNYSITGSKITFNLIREEGEEAETFANQIMVLNGQDLKMKYTYKDEDEVTHNVVTSYNRIVE